MGTKDDKLKAFFNALCTSFAASIRALSLYPPEHPETRKKLGGFFQALDKYLQQRPALAMIFVNSEVVVENTPLPELSANLAKLIDLMESMKLQRILFNRGVSQEEVVQQMTRIYLRLLMQRTGGNRSEAARIAGLQRGYLRRLLEKYGMVPD